MLRSRRFVARLRGGDAALAHVAWRSSHEFSRRRNEEHSTPHTSVCRPNKCEQAPQTRAIFLAKAYIAVMIR